MPSGSLLCSGLVERIGESNAQYHYKSTKDSYSEEINIGSHREGLQKITESLLHPKHGILKRKEDLHAVGHRVVHGGKVFANTIVITEQVKDQIREFSSLAPLHNPNNLLGIELSEEIFPDAVQVAVFDTAFHRTIPVKAKKYAIPNQFYREMGIQLYGFHGTSHKYVSQKAIAYLQKSDAKIVTIHLGNGCSITAVENGISVDHSLGFAPSNGLIMGTRSGDIDHSIIFYLVEELGYSLAEVKKILNQESGMLGLTGYSDLREIQKAAEEVNEDCILALEMNAYRIKKYIGAYTAAMNGLDAVVFTAGIGENSAVLRSMVCRDMDYFGIAINEELNQLRSPGIRDISLPNSKVKILIIPTNEELEIAQQTFDMIKKGP